MALLNLLNTTRSVSDRLLENTFFKLPILKAWSVQGWIVRTEQYPTHKIT